MNITQILATELNAKPHQVDAAINLLDEGLPYPLFPVIVKRRRVVYRTLNCVI